MGPRPPSPCSANKRSHRRKKPAPHKEEQPSLATTGEIPRAATKTQCSQKFKNRLIFKERENKKDLRLWLIGPCGGPPGSRSGSALTLLGCLGAGACGLRICPLPWGQVRAGVWAMGGWGMGGAHPPRSHPACNLSSAESLKTQTPQDWERGCRRVFGGMARVVPRGEWERLRCPDGFFFFSPSSLIL